MQQERKGKGNHLTLESQIRKPKSKSQDKLSSRAEDRFHSDLTLENARFAGK
ncbi:hypothetical protein OIDMADRAFT_18359 [Oidiodendron maius Zn]|uniref:Uncharacterized protein n=1 Tax=Oidiodendron maius (strain Zn) TaxID=913774 RepID=A0A0C3DKL7_OIDMZ|nr:hypothetical protein OIDMADRAFT_18359 [Oidiodendron maius Zn]